LATFNPTGLEKSICGTPVYSSPEMLAGKTYSFGNDIWQLGVSMFQFAALELPWTASSVPELKRN